ncbi:Predicted arabinose efflux permease, MFS family [Spirosomataceae bacterium TFI 002]|nr:Predicted arabinose efflux permease, MFS family [Spirosomataceae bacterium TFI 002]
MTTKEKLLLFILACVNFTHIVDFMILMPLGPNLMKVFDISPAQFGYVVSSYGIAAGISGFTLAFFADRFDRKSVLFTAYIGFVIGTFACAMSPTYEVLMVARTLTGVFGGMIGSQVLSIVADTFGYERRATAMGIIMTAFSVASVVGVPGGLYLANLYNWHAPFFLVGALGIVVIPLIYFFVPNVNSHLQKHVKGNPFKVVSQILKTPNQLWALGLSTVIMLGHFSIIPFIAPSLVANAGFAESDIYLIYLVGGVLTIFSAPIVGKLADKKGKYPIFVVFAFLSMLPIFFITNLSPMPLYVILVISGFFFIATNGRIIPTQAMVSSVVQPQQRGSFMAINSSVQLMAQAIATNIGGAIIIERADGYLDNYEYVGYYAMFMIFLAVFVAKQVKSIE